MVSPCPLLSHPSPSGQAACSCPGQGAMLWAGAAHTGQEWGHPAGPSSIFCLFAWTSRLGTGSPARTPPNLGRPVAPGQTQLCFGLPGGGFSQPPEEVGKRAGVAQGAGMPSRVLVSSAATTRAWGAAAAAFHCAPPSSPAAKAEGKYFSHLGHFLWVQIPPQRCPAGRGMKRSVAGAQGQQFTPRFGKSHFGGAESIPACSR